jgi:hypothetical protein
VREAYRIEGITAPECRSILLDWALSLPVDADPAPSILVLLDRHAAAGDHPMTDTLRAGLPAADPPRRRGGRKARVQP